MACEIQTHKYINFVQNLIKFDPQVYRNFDNAASFVLNSDLTPEQKKLSLHNLAHIYNGLSGIDTSFYEAGKSKDVMDAVHLIADSKAYIDMVAGMFDAKVRGSVTATDIEKAIKRLYDLPIIDRNKDMLGPDGIISLFKTFLATSGATGVKREEVIYSFINSVRDAINSFTDDPAYNEFLTKLLKTEIEALAISTPYIPLANVAELANLDNILVSMADMQLVGGVLVDGAVYIFDNEGSLVELSPDEYINYKSARPATSKSNANEEQLNPDFFMSAFTYRAAYDEDKEKLDEEFAKLENPMSRIKIHAMKLTAAADRVERLQELAKTDPAFEALAKRKHETFENESQIKYLQTTPDGTVLSVARPTQEEQGFSIVGELKLEDGSSIFFNMFSLDNYVFVNSDNTTEKVNLANPGHASMFAKLAQKRTFTGPETISESELATLAASDAQFQAFKERVMPALSELFDAGRGSVEITNEFFEEYAMQMDRVKQRPSLAALLDKDSTISLELDIATVDKQDNVVSSEKRKLPFVFVRSNSSDTGYFTISSFLGANEKIMIGDAVLTEQAFIEEVLGIDDIDAFIKTKILNSSNNSRTETKLALRFKDGMPYSYMPVETEKPLSAAPVFADYIISLASVLESTAKGEAVKNFNRERYRFSGGKSAFFLGLEHFNGQVQLELRPKDKTASSPFYFMLSRENKSQFNFPFTAEEIKFITNLASALKAKGKLIKQVIAETPSLGSYDIETEEGLSDFYAALTSLADMNRLGAKGMELINKIAESREKFTQMLIDKVVKTLPERTQDMPEFMPLFKQIFTSKAGNYNPDFLVMDLDADGNRSPHVRIIRDNKKGSNGYYQNISLFQGQRSNDPRMAVVPKGAARVGVEAKAILDSTNPTSSGPVVTPSSAPKTTVETKVTPDDIIAAFVKLQDVGVNNLSTEEQKIVDNPVYSQMYTEFNEMMGENPPFETENVSFEDLLGSMQKNVQAFKEELQDSIDEQTGDKGAPSGSPTITPTMDNDKIIDVDDEAFKISDEYEAASENDLLKESSWLAQNLPQFGLTSSDLSEVINLAKIDGTVLGIFKDKVIHLNNSMAAKGIVYHEAFHGVFRYLLTGAERRALLDKVINDKAHKSKFTDAALKEFARVRNFTYNKADIIDLIAEEVLADGFMRFMQKEATKAPRGIIAQFMAMLKRMIDFFMKNKDIIESTYSDIATGRYKNAVIQSGMFDGKVAFEVIPGLKKLSVSPTGDILNESTDMGETAKNQLVNMATMLMLNASSDSKKTFEQKFQDAATEMLDSIYNIDMLVRQAPALKDQIIAKYGPMYDQYRFALGARMRGLTVSDINMTGNPEYDNQVLRNMNEGEDNINGAQSMAALMRLVRQRVNEISAVATPAKKQMMLDEMERLAHGGEAKGSNEDADTNEEVSESAGYDNNLSEYNRLESLPAEFRKFIATIRRDKTDTELGIKVPTMVDAKSMFPTLLQITSNIDPWNIVNHIKLTYEQMLEDGYVDAHEDLKAIYNKIDNLTSINKDGFPMNNLQTYAMIINVLHGTEMDYVMFNIYNPEEAKPDEDPMNMDFDKNQDVRFTLRDKVQYEDINNKKRRIVERMILTQKAKKNDPAYKAAQQTLAKLAESVAVSEQLFSGLNPEKRLNKLVDEIHDAMVTVGMNIPKSLVRLSLIAIEQKENDKTIAKLGKETLAKYAMNKEFADSRTYLEKKFFKDLSNIMKRAIGSERKSVMMFQDTLDNEDTKDKEIRSFNSILRKVSKYIVKYDPTQLPNTVFNAEGKPIYRYVKYTPLTMIAQDVRTKGLEATLAEDPYYEKFLKDFVGNNKMLGDVLNGKDTAEARRAKLFLDNMRISLFGGVQQVIGSVYMDGKSFKGLDERSLHMLNFLSFLNRTTESTTEADGTETSIQTYMRTYYQLESSQTNFLVSAMHQTYATKDGMVKNGKGKDATLKVTEDLKAVIRQEYERIRKELMRRDALKKAFEAGEENGFVKDFNGRLAADGRTVVFTDIKGQPLRAYTFGKLADFFTTGQTEEDARALADLKEGLLQLAAEDVPFDEIDLGNMPQLLSKYAERQFDVFMQKMESNKIIQKEEVQVKDKDGVPTGEVINYYSSKLLPTKMKVDFGEGVSLLETYGFVEGANITMDGMDITGKKVNMTNMFADYFYNNWVNTLHINDIFDGDAAMNIKNAQDMVKRAKKFLAAGDSMKQGKHRAMVMNTIYGFIHDEYPQYGPYYSRDEISDDNSLTEALKETMLETYDNAVSEQASKGKGPYAGMMHKIFDGQSVSLLMHQMDMHESMGRLNAEVHNILIAKHYRALTQGEIATLESMKVVNNPKKTIVAARTAYHKMSENLFDRMDNSMYNPDMIEGMSLEEVEDHLHTQWARVYELRKQYQRETAEGLDNTETAIQIKNIIKDEIHSYYLPLPHRVMAYNMLNAMEYHQIDHLMDTEASKNATTLPIDIFAQPMVDGYMNLQLSAVELDNKFKILQVETSGIKDKAKLSVQAKVLLPADVNKLADIISSAQGRELSETERTQVDRVAEKLLDDYESTLKDATRARLLYLTSIMREGGNFKIDKVYNLIRENLLAQGASVPTLKLFELNADGTPKYSPNLPEIRNMLQFYFFSQYSKHVTDEKGAGFKNVHISSFGYDVLEDADTGEVIKTSDYRKNPTAYPNVRSRKLGVVKEPELDINGNPTGKDIYYVECIIPEPLDNNPAFREFFEEYLTKMFGTRIPTEDKRSMVVLKAVDYMDSSNMNGIVVPHFVHLLAGSDFDVDALYGQKFSYYKDLAGKFNVFGKYNNFRSEREGKFVEFVHYMSKRDEFSELVKQRERALKEEGSFDLDTDSEVFKFLKMLGFTENDFQNVIDTASLAAEESRLSEFLTLLDERQEELGPLYDQLRDNIETGAVTPGKKGKKNSLENQKKEVERLRQGLTENVAQRKSAVEEIKSVKQELWNKQPDAKRFTRAALKAMAMFQVFESYGIPMTIEGFEEYPLLNQIVADKYQNQNLQARMNLLGNELVFTNLYINERSSVDRFKEILGEFGIDMDEIAGNTNHYTITSIINSKVMNSMNKDGIGITANINKFLAMASWYNLELKEPIWQFYNSNDATEQKMYKMFGTINEEDIRTIALIGNVLGMFADGAKEPIPAALNMNEVNTGLTLAMIGIGLSPEFSLGFNFIPEIKNAVSAVQATKFAINESAKQQYLFLNNAVSQEMYALMNEDNSIFEELKSMGLLDEVASPGNLLLNKNNLVIDFAAKKLDPAKQQSNTLSITDIGYKVSVKGSAIPLSENAQKILLMRLYMEQAQQAWSLAQAGSLTAMLKKINPDFYTFDKMMTNIGNLFGEGSLFTEESVKRLENDQVWSTLIEMMIDLDEQSSLMFVERSKFFRPIKKVFDNIFKDKSNVAKTITGFVGIQKMLISYPGSRKSSSEYIQSLIDREDDALQDTFDANFWFTHNLGAELVALQEKYPDNRFLQILKEEKGPESTTIIAPDGKKYFKQPFRYIKMINSVSFSGPVANEIANDAISLSKDLEAKLFLKKLYFHELARTGMGSKAGSFMMFLPTEFKKESSINIEEFLKALERGSKKPETFNDEMMSFLDTDNMDDVYYLFDNLFINMAYAGSKEPNNTSIKYAQKLSVKSEKTGLYTSALVKSLDVPADTTDAEKSVIAGEIISQAFGGKFTVNAKQGFTPDFKTLGDSFTLNLAPEHVSANEAVMFRVGKALGVKPTTAVPGVYEFPIVFKSADGVAYMLQGVNDQTETGSVGKHIYEGIVEGGGFNMIGTSARYVRIPTKMMSTALSPLGFGNYDINRFVEITAPKGVINYADPEVKPETPEKIVEKVVEVEVKPPFEEPAQEPLTPLAPEASTKEEFMANFAGDGGIGALLGKAPAAPAAPAVPKIDSFEIEPGRYVTYKGATYIVTKMNTSGTIQIYNPLLEGPKSKVSVSAANIKPMATKAEIVDYKGKPYLVTPKDTIISMTTNKKMQWEEGNGDRRAIFALRDAMTKFQPAPATTPVASSLENDLNSLDMTEQALQFLYSESSKRKTFESFAKEAKRMALQLRGTDLTTKEILDNIRCL